MRFDEGPEDGEFLRQRRDNVMLFEPLRDGKMFVVDRAIGVRSIGWFGVGGDVNGVLER